MDKAEGAILSGSTAALSRASGTDLVGGKGMRKGQTHRHMYRKPGIGWTELSEGEVTVPSGHLLYTVEPGGRHTDK